MLTQFEKLRHLEMALYNRLVFCLVISFILDFVGGVA